MRESIASSEINPNIPFCLMATSFKYQNSTGNTFLALIQIDSDSSTQSSEMTHFRHLKIQCISIMHTSSHYSECVSKTRFG